jgi:hypothetical protein
MSLAETQEILSVLQEIIGMLEDAGYKVDKVKSEVTGESSNGVSISSGHSLRSELRIMNGYMIAIQRWAGNDTLTATINKVQEANAAIIRGYMLLSTLNDIMMASTLNPFAIAYAGAHALGFGISIQNLMSGQ